jgi:hypothetical protein
VLNVDPFSAVSGSASEHEPFIAVSPGGRVGVSFLSILSSGVAYTEGYRISNDRGTTWGPATLFAVPKGTNVQANASVAAGDDGTLYMAWGAEEHVESGRSNQGVYVAKSAPGTTTFETPVLVTDPSTPVAVYDQPRVVVTHAGVVIVSWDETAPNGYTSWIQQARSTDGTSWTLSYAVGSGSPESYRDMPRYCRPAGEGRIFLYYLDSDVALWSEDIAVALRYSDDDGMTWSAPLDVTSEADELILDPTAAIGCTTDGTNVWMVYGLTPEADLGGTQGGGAAPSSAVEHTMTRVRLAHSGDGGKTIDVRNDVMDTRVANRAMYPVLAYEGASTLDLAYYAGAFDNDTNGDLRRTRSTDGMTFAPTVSIHHPLTLETNRAAPQWVGDYTGAAFQGGDLFLVYTDNATTASHIAFYRTPSALPAQTGEPDAEAPAPDAGEGCYTGATFTPVTWAPPTPFAQGACNTTQLNAYLACSGASCAAFRSDSSNAACLACLETDESAPAHGPFVTQASDGGVAILEVNYGGCQAHYDGQTASGCCGEQMNNNNDCFNAECETCSDFANPAEYGPTYDCYFTSLDVGVCTQYRETTACVDETFDGGVAAPCGDPSIFVPSWCGP